MTKVALSLGSNLGDRGGLLLSMERSLQTVLNGPLCISSLMETGPVGTPDSQPSYFNRIVTGSYQGSPYELLDECLKIENSLGRTRNQFRGARTADIDILLFGDLVIESNCLKVPHPELANRRFCLEGLAQIDALWVIPGLGQTVQDLLNLQSAKLVDQKITLLSETVLCPE